MALLSTDQREEGSSRKVLLLIVAVCLAFAGVWCYVFLTTKPPVAAGVITQIAAVPIHTEMKTGGTAEEGVGGGVETTDELFVLVNATVRDRTKIPLFPFEQMGKLTTQLGEQKQARALSTYDMMRAFRAYPALAAAHAGMAGPALARETTLKPNEAEHGLVLFMFPLTKADWDSRRSFDLDISFRWQKDLVVMEPAAK
jgi:hypothetical protein